MQELLRLMLAGEAVGADDRLAGVAAGLPLVILVYDKSLDFIEVGRCQACAGVANGLRQKALIGRGTEYGLFATECLEELGGHHSVRRRVCQHQQNATSPDFIAYFGDWNGVAVGCMEVEPKTGEGKFTDSLLNERGALELKDTSDVGDEKLFGWYILRVELYRVIAVVDKVDVGIEAAQEIHVPRGDGSDAVGMAQDTVAPTDIDRAIDAPERPRPPSAMGL